MFNGMFYFRKKKKRSSFLNLQICLNTYLDSIYSFHSPV